MPTYVKPAWPVWQPGHPLATDARLVLTYTDPGRSTTDAVQGIRTTATGLAAMGTGVWGPAVAWTGDTSRWVIPYRPSLRPSKELTIACACETQSLTSGYGLVLGMDNGTRELEFVLGYGMDQIRLIVTVAGARKDYTSPTGFLLPGPHTYVTTRKLDGSIRFYVDGTPVTVFGAAAPGDITDTGGNLRVGSLSGQSGQPRKDAITILAGRAWTDDEVRLFSLEPFAIVRPQSNLALWAALAGGSPSPFVGSPAAMMMGF